MKKIVSILLIVFLIASMLAGCEESDDNNQKTSGGDSTSVDAVIPKKSGNGSANGNTVTSNNSNSANGNTATSNNGSSAKGNAATSNNGGQNNTNQSSQDITGMWTHNTEKDKHYILIHGKNGNNYNVNILTVNQMGTLWDYAVCTNVNFSGGKADFKIKSPLYELYCHISIQNNSLEISFTDELFFENASWAVCSMPNKSYSKTKELSQVPDGFMDNMLEKLKKDKYSSMEQPSALNIDQYLGSWMFMPMEDNPSLSFGMVVEKSGSNSITLRYADFLNDAVFISDTVAESPRFGDSKEMKTVYTFSKDSGGRYAVEVRTVNVNTNETVGDIGHGYKE